MMNHRAMHCLLLAGTLTCGSALAAGPTSIRWEAERATQTNMRTDQTYRPKNAKQMEVLSGGAWLNGKQKPGDEPRFADYTIEVPFDSTYQFYIRKFWQHGPFRYRFDDKAWVNVDNQPPILESVTISPHVLASWLKAGSITLPKGTHTFRFETLVGKKYQFSDNYGFDCFLLYNGGEHPEGKAGLKANTRNTFSKLKLMDPAPSDGWKAALVVNPRHSQARNDGPGTQEAPLRTINAAARRAKPGDVILVAAGIYRESIVPVRGGTGEKPIRYIASPQGEVIVRGSEIWTPGWRAVSGRTGVYAAAMDSVPLADNPNPFLRAISINPNDTKKPSRPVDEEAGKPLLRSLGQIFVNGSMYVQARATSLLDAMPGSWMVSPDGTRILVHFKTLDAPSRKPLVEVSVRQQLFCPAANGLAYIQIKGFTFEHAANQGPFPQLGMVSVRGGHHWRIEGNTIRFANTIGLDCGKKGDELAGFNVIANNTITDNGLCGIAGIKHIGTRICSNLIARNNMLDFDNDEAGWLEWGGIKLHICEDVVIEGNTVRDNECFGIWLDNQYRNARVTRNVVLNNTLAGIFFELGSGPALIDHNIVAHTRRRSHHNGGEGIYAHDASGLTIAHNLVFANAGDGVRTVVLTDRHTGGHPVDCSGHRIFNNIIMANNQVAISLPAPNPRAGDNQSDYNHLFGTHEYWEGMDNWPALMSVNRFKGDIRREDIVAALRHTLMTEEIPKLEWPNLLHWPKQPVLSLPLWQLFMKQDLHSVESFASLKVHLRPLQSVIELKPSAAFFKLRGPRIEKTDVDFLGNPLPQENLAVGPFQGLQEGVNQISLLPYTEQN